MPEEFLGVGKGAPWVLLLSLFCVLAGLSWHKPYFISDQGNKFLADFLDNDLLAVLGFITAVGNAATLNIFLHLNKLEDESDFKPRRVRGSLKNSATSLVYVFLVAFVVVSVKPILPSDQRWEAFANTVGICCVFFSLSVLRDLTITVFHIPTKKRILEIKLRNLDRN